MDVRFGSAMTALGFKQNQPLAVGFSGGGDSLALLALACAFSAPSKVTALIVDHGLRQQSAEEADSAANMARALGARHRILTWKNPKSGQARARTARYCLLANACRAEGRHRLLVAHTFNDQEETFLLRLQGGSSPRGLACMSALAPLPVWPEGRGLWLARPLLGCSRTALRHWLEGRGLGWIEDPSNRNRRYGRVRARRKLAALYDHGLPDKALSQANQALAALEDERRRQAADLLGRCVQWHEAGFARIQRDIFGRAGSQIGTIMLAAVLAGVAGRGGQVVPARLVGKIMARFLMPDWKAFCAAGCRMQDMLQTVLVSRDPGAVLGRGACPVPHEVFLGSAGEAVFDGRFAVRGPQGAQVRALGYERSGLCTAQRQSLAALPAAVRPVVPVMVDQTGRIILTAPGKAPKDAPETTPKTARAIFLGPQIAARVLARFSQGLHQRL